MTDDKVTMEDVFSFHRQAGCPPDEIKPSAPGEKFSLFDHYVEAQERMLPPDDADGHGSYGPLVWHCRHCDFRGADLGVFPVECDD